MSNNNEEGKQEWIKIIIYTIIIIVVCGALAKCNDSIFGNGNNDFNEFPTKP